MIRAMVMALCLGGLLPAAAGAQSSPTADSLIKSDFVVVSSFASQAGPGLFLQKKDELYFCLVAETQNSPNVAKRYCEPVR